MKIKDGRYGVYREQCGNGLAIVVRTKKCRTGILVPENGKSRLYESQYWKEAHDHWGSQLSTEVTNGRVDFASVPSRESVAERRELVFIAWEDKLLSEMRRTHHIPSPFAIDGAYRHEFEKWFLARRNARAIYLTQGYAWRGVGTWYPGPVVFEFAGEKWVHGGSKICSLDVARF